MLEANLCIFCFLLTQLFFRYLLFSLGRLKLLWISLFLPVLKFLSTILFLSGARDIYVLKTNGKGGLDFGVGDSILRSRVAKAV